MDNIYNLALRDGRRGAAVEYSRVAVSMRSVYKSFEGRWVNEFKDGSESSDRNNRL